MGDAVAERSRLPHRRGLGLKVTAISRNELQASIDAVVSSIAQHTQAALDRRDIRIAELEARIVTLEGRTAPAKPRVRVPALRAVA